MCLKYKRHTARVRAAYVCVLLFVAPYDRRL